MIPRDRVNGKPTVRNGFFDEGILIFLAVVGVVPGEKPEGDAAGKEIGFACQRDEVQMVLIPFIADM